MPDSNVLFIVAQFVLQRRLAYDTNRPIAEQVPEIEDVWWKLTFREMGIPDPCPPDCKNSEHHHPESKSPAD